MMRKAFAAALVVSLSWTCVATAADELVLVNKGAAPIPIILDKDATSATKQTAQELATYIGKVTGARPEVQAAPELMPEHAIWVGMHPALINLFPDTDFKFTKPEEILIVCDGRNIAIVGRDQMVNNVQSEFGTANAVYTFIQDKMGVRWLWPGPLGEDVPKKGTLTFAPFTYRYAPIFLTRDVFIHAERWGNATDWIRLQRLSLSSRRGPAGSHAYTDWWERFGETHPEYFALQPDGTRSGWPGGHTAKLCVSNPDVWKQWLADAEAKVKSDPTLNYLIASPNDGHSSGVCICEKCRAWDRQDAPPWSFSWEGASQEYVSLADRYVTFWNHLAKLLRERYPDRNDLFVRTNAYGPTLAAPLDDGLAENTVMGFVGLFPTVSDAARDEAKAQWKAWSKKAPNMLYRPNLWYFGGGVWGLPEVPLTRTMEDFRFLAEHSCIGLMVDSAWEHWSNEGPQYYLMAQLAWNPLQDGKAVLADYYVRGFGPAAAEIERYWTLMDKATNEFYDSPDFQIGSRGRFTTVGIVRRIYSDDLLEQATAYLDRAAKLTADGPDVYGKRVAFVRTGLDVTKLMVATIPLMDRVRLSDGRDAEAVRQAAANWAKIEEIANRAGRFSFRLSALYGNIRGNYMGGVDAYLGPPSDKYLKAAEENPATPEELAEIARKEAEAAAMDAAAANYEFTTAEEAGWKLIYEEDFARDDLGEDWTVQDGTWEVKDGGLVGTGRIISSKGFPGYQRMEFEAVTAVDPVVLVEGAEPGNVVVSDMSSFIHAKSVPNPSPTRTGYFFQFGGYLNTQNQLRRAGQTIKMDESGKKVIEPGKVHKIVVENDEGYVRFIIDGELLLQMVDTAPLVGRDQSRIGFYFYTKNKVMNLKLYTKPFADDLI